MHAPTSNSNRAAPVSARRPGRNLTHASVCQPVLLLKQSFGICAVLTATTVSLIVAATVTTDVTLAATIRQALAATQSLTAAANEESTGVAATPNAATDAQRPAAPALLSATPSRPAEVTLTWNASAGVGGVQGYRIVRNGRAIASVTGGTLSYSDTTAAPGATYAYSVKAYDAAGTYSLASNTASVATPTASAAATIASCGEITRSGSYVLSGDLTAGPNSTCLNIHDATNVQVDCQQHGITIDRNNDSGLDSAVVVKNVTNYSIGNCRMIALNTSQSVSLPVLSISNSPAGTIAANTISGGYVIISASDNLEIAHNISDTSVEVYGNNERIEYNTIALSGSKIYAAALLLGNSTGSTIQANQLNGGWDGVVRGTIDSQVGADDGILLESVTNAVVQNNTILNTWDCGIENTGAMVNVQLLDNQIATAGNCGVGGWYGESLKEVTVAGNTVTDAPTLFWYVRADSLYAGEQWIYCQDNTFSNNKLVRPRLSFYTPGSGRLDFQQLPPSIPPSAVVAGNNRIAGNDFGPFGNTFGLFPGGSMVDGGGNSCVSDPDNPAFPLHCGPPQSPSGGYYAIAALPAAPSVILAGSQMTVMFGASPGAGGDYIGLAMVGADDQHFSSSQATAGFSSGLLMVTAPSTPGAIRTTLHEGR